jgi:hypothetical protein
MNQIYAPTQNEPNICVPKITPENVTYMCHAGSTTVIANLPSGLAHDSFLTEEEATEFITEFYGIPADEIIETPSWGLRPWENGPYPKGGVNPYRRHIINGEATNG